MVSVQEAQRQREKQLRAERLKQARQVGSELGKMGARRYQDAKKEQRSKVNAHLREQWQSEQSSRLQQSESMSFEIERRRGEGMRNAEAFVGQQYDTAAQEKAAWEAERSLEQQRMQVGLQENRLKREEEKLKSEEAQARRAYVKQVEEVRSKRAVVLATRTNEANARLRKEMATGDNSDSPASFLSPARAGGGPAVTLHTKDDARESAEREAAKLAEQRQRDQQRKQTELQKRQEAAKQRAMKAMEEDRLAQEKIRIEKEQELAFKAKMMEENFRRGPNSVTVDYQEQEARKATAMNRKAHVEFEETFLRGPWKDAMSSHRPPAEDTSATSHHSNLSRLSWSAAEMNQEDKDQQNSAPPSWLTTILGSSGAGIVSSSGVRHDDDVTAASLSGGGNDTAATTGGNEAAVSSSSSPTPVGLRLKAIPLQVTSLVVDEGTEEEIAEQQGSAQQEGHTPVAEGGRFEEGEEARGTSPEPHDFIPIPQPKLSQNTELMEQVESILAAAGVDAGEFPGVVAAATSGTLLQQEQEEKKKRKSSSSKTGTTTAVYTTTTATGTYSDLGQQQDDFEEEEGEEDDDDEEDTEDEFERVASQQRVNLREQHERYLNDLNQLRERIANSAAGNLKPAASYVDPTLLLPPLSSSSSATMAGGQRQYYHQQLGQQEEEIPAPTSSVVKINPRYQLVAMSEKAKLLEQQQEMMMEDEEHDEQLPQQQVTAAAVGDTTLSPMSTPDKTTGSKKGGPTSSRSVNFVSSSSDEEE